VTLISASIARIVSSTADLAILNHLIACDRQIYAERLGNSEHERIPDLPVADGLALLLPPRILRCGYGPAHPHDKELIEPKKRWNAF
jgi:hypothetical protein